MLLEWPRSLFGLSLKSVASILLVFEVVFTLALIVVTVLDLIFSNTRLSAPLNGILFILSTISVGSFISSLKRRRPLLAVPMLVNQSVQIFWCFLWMFAAVTAISTGFLFEIEALGGPNSNKAVYSKDILDDNYVDPNETKPETAHSYKYGLVILVACMPLFLYRVFAFNIAKHCFLHYQKVTIERHEKAGQFEMEPPDDDDDLSEKPIVVKMREKKKTSPSSPIYSTGIIEDLYGQISPAPSSQRSPTSYSTHRESRI